MPRVNHVKSARALYETKPDIDPVTGGQKTALVFKSDGVTPKTDKRGSQIVRRLTVRDLDRPKPNLRCDFPGCADPEIRPGQSYKFLALRFGQKNRHEEHPSWQHWEYSSSVAAQAARVAHDLHGEIDSFEFTAPGDFEDLRGSLQEQVQAFQEERQEALDNMPEQLQDGSQAAEYADLAQEWADAFDNVDGPDEDEAFEDCETCSGQHEVDCDTCGGEGKVEADEDDEEADEDGEKECPDCGGTGRVDCDECDEGKTDVLSEDWVEAARDALREAVDEGQF